MYDLDQVNNERRRRGLPPLTRAQAQQASSHDHIGIDPAQYLAGVALYSYATSMADTGPSYSGGGGDFGGGGSSSSYDSGGSSGGGE